MPWEFSSVPSNRDLATAADRPALLASVVKNIGGNLLERLDVSKEIRAHGFRAKDAFFLVWLEKDGREYLRHKYMLKVDIKPTQGVKRDCFFVLLEGVVNEIDSQLL